MNVLEGGHWRRTGCVTILSAEDQEAVFLPLDLPETAQVAELGDKAPWLSTGDTSELLTRLESVLAKAPARHRTVVEEAINLVERALDAGTGIAVLLEERPRSQPL
jgi:hypothetical protein